MGAADTEYDGKTEAGLELVEALKIRRTLADKNPERNLPYVASNILSDFRCSPATFFGYSTGCQEWSGSKRVIGSAGFPATGAMSF